MFPNEIFTSKIIGMKKAKLVQQHLVAKTSPTVAYGDINILYVNIFIKLRKYDKNINRHSFQLPWL